MTEWRPVAGYEGLYEVSACGKIKRLARVVNQCDGRIYPVREKILKDYAHPGGYRTTFLRSTVGVNGRPHYVHRIVAAAFHSNPDALPEVNHLNLDKADNRACNLEWVGSASNNDHAKANGLYHGRTNVRKRLKLVPETADAIRSSKGRPEDVAIIYGVSAALVRLIRKGARWQHPSEVTSWA